MNATIIVMLVLVSILVSATLLFHGTQGLFDGAKGSVQTLRQIWPLLLLALVAAGFMRVIIPRQLVASLVGPSSGIKGILIAWGAGALIPGAPYVMLPIAASLLSSGAAIGPVMTMVLSGGVGLAITRIPYEIAFIGPRFTVARIAVCILFPPIGGILAQCAARWLRWGFSPGPR